MRKLEFRVPISPTEGFFGQVRFFDAALRRLGGDYGQALLTVIVGDKCDIEDVRKRNRWSHEKPVRWIRVPDEIFDRYAIAGTGYWTFMPEAEGEVIIFSDADTVLVRDVDPAVRDVAAATCPTLAGHMSHYPPPVESGNGLPPPGDVAFWPALLDALNVPQPPTLHRYSCDVDSSMPLAPPYFNFGFVAFNRGALQIYRETIIDAHEEFDKIITSDMSAQMQLTAIALRHSIQMITLPAEYNAANDLTHFCHNDLIENDIRVIHYLRTHEIDRSQIFTAGNFEPFLQAKLDNPVDRLLQRLARELAPAMGYAVATSNTQALAKAGVEADHGTAPDLQSLRRVVLKLQKKVVALQESLERAGRSEEDLEKALSALVRRELVNEEFYRFAYGEPPDGMSCVAHYIRHGWRQGCDPNPWFSTRAYLEAHPDVAEAGVVPLRHYTEQGWREGRKVTMSEHGAAFLKRVSGTPDGP